MLFTNIRNYNFNWLRINNLFKRNIGLSFIFKDNYLNLDIKNQTI